MGSIPSSPEAALDRAAALIAEVCGGRVARGRVGDDRLDRSDRPRITLRHARYATLIGKPTTTTEALLALKTLGFEVTPGDGGDELTVGIPSWRFDVTREADLVEEVARLEGYASVPAPPLPAPPVSPAQAPRQIRLARLSRAATAAGFDECYTPSFVGADVLGADPGLDNLVEIRNPISKSDRFLRPFVVTNLARVIGYNLKRGAPRAKLFEVGHAFELGGGVIVERERLAFAAAGLAFHWTGRNPSRPTTTSST